MKHTEYIIPIGEDAKDFDEIFIGVLRKHKELIRCQDCTFYNDNTNTCGNPLGTIKPARGDYCSQAAKEAEE